MKPETAIRIGQLSPGKSIYVGNNVVMRFRCLLLSLLISISSFCQNVSRNSPERSDTSRIDTIAVNALISLSKQAQWIDSYRSLHYASRALRLAQSLHFKSGIASANNLRGFSFWAFGDNDLAIKAALEALEATGSENYPLIQAESYYILARGYLDVDEGKIALQSIQKAEALAYQGKNWELLCSIYNLKGVILFIEHKTDSALHFYNKAFELGKNHAVDSVNFPRILSNIGECYSYSNPTRALTYFKRALQLAKETHNRTAEASIMDVLGHAYLRSNDVRNAESNFQASLALARSLGLRRVVRHVYAGLVDTKLKQGMGAEAVVFQRRYHEVNDSLLNTAKIRQIVELEAKHELQLKERNIKILESENRIQTIWRNLLIVAIVVLILFSVGLYQLQQYRHRKNREILDLEIDYLTQQHQETKDKFKATLVPGINEKLESADQKVLKQAISVIENNIGDPFFSVETMAHEMNMSRTSLHRKLKSITGFPPGELIRSMRLRKAAKLIASKADSVTQVALLVGFDDYSHFSKSFKKQFGVSPTSYEEKATEL